jgi:hypothetical protein
MSRSRVHSAGSVALGLSLAIFALYFLNVLFGGPLGRKPWMSDVGEMLTLFAAVIFFVAGAICREFEQSGNGTRQKPEGQG